MLSYKEIAKIFEEIELRLIASLKRNLHRHKQWESREGFQWSAWQAEKLRNLDKFRRENINIMNEYVDVIDDETRQLMEEQFKEGEELVKSQFEELKQENPEADKSSLVTPENFFGVNNEKMQSLMTDITELEKRAETAALRMTDDIYRQTVNKVQLAMATGETTLTKAIDMAVQDFLDKGINCIVYKDGRRVNIVDYVRMALRTTAQRAALQGKAKQFAELGWDTVMVSQYSMCSATCEPYQGKAYIDDVFTVWHGEVNGDYGKSNYCGKWFMLLSVAISNGLFHPNCRHDLSQYIDGLTKIPEPLDSEKLKERRKLEEKQRRLENKIRKYNRYVNGCADPRNVQAYKKKRKEAKAELMSLINANPKILKYNEDIVKYYDGEAPKGSLDNYNPRGIIEEEIKNGSVILEINHEKQARHLLGEGYIEGRSYFTVSEDELTRIIKEKYGTGTLQFNYDTNDWKHKEVIEIDKDIGICIDRKGNKSPTNRFTVHYSKTGVHLVPTKKKE